jgi:hypothetical protein
MTTAIVKASELGSCWRPERFLGGECKLLPTCHKKKEKQTCKAHCKKSKTEVEFAPGAGGIDYQI